MAMRENKYRDALGLSISQRETSGVFYLSRALGRPSLIIFNRMSFLPLKTKRPQNDIRSGDVEQGNQLVSSVFVRTD
jgi:hypothetical protein